MSVAEWQKTIELARQDVMDLLWQREQMKRFELIVRSNPRVLSFQFPADVRSWFSVWAAMVIRRHVDRGQNVYSLRALLESMLQEPHNFTRETIASIATGPKMPTYTNDMATFLTDSMWKQIAAPCGQHLNTELVKADLDSIIQISKKIVVFVNKRIAHHDRDALPQKGLPNYDDLDTCIHRFEEVAIRWTSALTGAGYSTLLPTEQFDWWELFEFPWRPRDDNGSPITLA